MFCTKDVLLYGQPAKYCYGPRAEAANFWGEIEGLSREERITLYDTLPDWADHKALLIAAGRWLRPIAAEKLT